MFTDDVKTNRTLKNIKLSLDENLKHKYNIIDKSISETILKIHGLHIDNFDVVSNITKLINEKLNDISIDANSNKSEKTIESINQEVTSPIKKTVGFDYLYRIMKDNFGQEEAKFLVGEILDFSLGLSDSTNILKPYCWAIDATKIVTIGRPFGQLHSKPTRRISSYISSLCETIHQLSNHLAGAVAIGTFFLDLTHLSIYRHGWVIEDLKAPKTRKFIENELQQFVHSVNHLSRNGNESPFTNISIFDREKLKNLLNDDNFGWYFPIKTEDGSNSQILSKIIRDLMRNEDLDNETEINKETLKQKYIEYIIEYIIEYQNIFLDFFDQGDPLSNGAPYRFPIVTVNISKHENGKLKIPDEIFLKEICKRDIYRYNIFTSEGSKVASCCRLISDIEMLELSSQVNSFGGGSSVSLGSHRVVTINFNRIALECDSLEEFYQILSKRVESAAKILKSHKDLLKILTDKGLQSFIKSGWIQINRLFSTFGILGIYEANLTLRKKFNGKIIKDSDLIGEILIIFNKKVNEISKQYGIIGNIEQIPAESFATRLANADRLIYGKEKVPFVLYSNQFIPLWENATIWEKMDMDGKYNKLITGGGIVHAMIGERVTSYQAEQLIKYAIKSGCEHFALNAVYSKCINNHTNFGKIEKCITCGGEIEDYYTRVVGFFVPISNWDKNRREWEFPRRTFITKEEIKETSKPVINQTIIN